MRICSRRRQPCFKPLAMPREPPTCWSGRAPSPRALTPFTSTDRARCALRLLARRDRGVTCLQVLEDRPQVRPAPIRQLVEHLAQDPVRDPEPERPVALELRLAEPLIPGRLMREGRVGDRVG